MEVEGRATRFRWVDVGDAFIALEPSVDLGADEKLVVRARYRDSASPSALTLTLVTRPAVVDKEVSVVRRARSREALEARVAELESTFSALKVRCEEGALPNLVFAGLLDQSLQVSSFQNWSRRTSQRTQVRGGYWLPGGALGPGGCPGAATRPGTPPGYPAPPGSRAWPAPP